MSERNRVGRCVLDVLGSRHDPAAGPCEHDNESWCFTGDREFLGQVVTR
jgi:hypothetical protein